jgi:DNA (cytosine-5)-methyltransferase 1
MKKEQEISIEEFDNKGFKDRFMGHPLRDQMKAIVTHYLHSLGNNEAMFFETEAESFLKELLRYRKQVTGQSISLKVAKEQLLSELRTFPFSPPEDYTFKFIDLFAGIGGFRIAMQNLGGKCVFTSEWDKEAQKTYMANFGEEPFGDITKEDTKRFIPKGFDVLCAGFPCQAFSIAGKRGGFEDTRGTLFFDVAEIIRSKNPRAFFLENVKGLRNHDKGRTLETILNVLRNDLGYFVPDPQVINAKDFGLAQNRERIFIVGFKREGQTEINKFKYPAPSGEIVKFGQIKEKKAPSIKYYLSAKYLKTLENHRERHLHKGNGFGYQLIKDNDIANAVVCGGMGRERNLVKDVRITDLTPGSNIKGKVNTRKIRRMTPGEWMELQGFPIKFKMPVSDTSKYKQLGNSVAVPAIQATAENVLKAADIKVLKVK